MDADPEHDGGGSLKTQLLAYFETVSWKPISTNHFLFQFLGCKPPSNCIFKVVCIYVPSLLDIQFLLAPPEVLGQKNLGQHLEDNFGVGDRLERVSPSSCVSKI